MGNLAKMSVLSRLIPSAIRDKSAILQQLRRRFGTLKHVDHPLEDTMQTVPSMWAWYKSMDVLLFWITIVAAPLVACSVYANIFIGPAKLKPIPEGYEPREDEYDVHPITRWFTRNVYISQQQRHEMLLHEKWEMTNTIRQNQLMAEVKRLMQERGDYIAYDYRPYSAHRVRIMNKVREDHQTIKGTYD